MHKAHREHHPRQHSGSRRRRCRPHARLSSRLRQSRQEPARRHQELPQRTRQGRHADPGAGRQGRHDPRREAAQGRPGHGGPGGEHLAAAAKALGLTEAELRAKLKDGKSLADVAKAEDVSTDTLVKALVAEAEERIDAAVKDGKLTKARPRSARST